MKFLSKTSLMAASAVLGLGLASGAASAEKTLRMATWLPPTHPIVAGMMKPWATEVEEASKGRLKVEIMTTPLGPPPRQFALAKDGAANITYGVHGYTQGVFKMTKLVELPFLADSAEDLSVAYQRVYEDMLAGQNEHGGTKVLGVFTHGPGIAFVRGREFNNIGVLRGLKIRVGGGVVSDVGKALGVVPVLKPAPASYEILSTGVADGIMFPAESIKSFKLGDVLDEALEVPGGFYNTSFFFVMNRKAYDDLPRRDRRAIDKVSGVHFAHIAGRAWDQADQAGREAMTGNVKLRAASNREVREIERILNPVVNKITAELTDAGIDGKKALARLKDEVAKASKENKEMMMKEKEMMKKEKEMMKK